jgi:hypothetical protein
LEGWKHKSLAERFHDTTKALVTETEVQLVIDALEHEKLRLESLLDDPEFVEKEEVKSAEWDLEVISSAIESLKSQLKGGEPVKPKEE